MAYCSNCGNQISDYASACPNCAQPTGAVGPSAHGAPGAQGPPGAQGLPGYSPSGLRYASFGQRFAGWLIDWLILFAAGLFLRGTASFGGFLIGFLYNWLMIAFNDGRTIGKMALGIRIARPDGGPVDLGTAAARAGMALVSGLVLGIGYLWAAWDPEHRTWHDMVADTRAFRIN